MYVSKYVGVVLAAALLVVMPLSDAHAAGKKKEKPSKAAKSEKKADEAGKPGARGFNLPKVETIEAKLGAKNKLTAKQKAAIEKVREELKAKYVETNNKPAVIAAKEAVKKAAGDKEKTAKAKEQLEKATGGFVASAEFKKALSEIFTKKQLAAYAPAKSSAKDEKSAAKDEDQKKTKSKSTKKKG